MDLILGGYLKKFADMKTFRCFETKDYNLDEILKINSVKTNRQSKSNNKPCN